MALSIELAQAQDLPEILDIYACARAFMAQNGNPTQWGTDYPHQALLLEDLQAQQLYICKDGSQTVGVFCYYTGIEQDYLTIYDGHWLNDRPYGVVHRLAVVRQGKGVAAYCLDFAFRQCGNLRIDTHADNLPMQRALGKNGFTYCGIIHCSHGGLRMAFQKQ